MATQFQGYDKKLNLKEATADRDIINNLAGFPVGDDIGLFVNNLRNVSTLIVTEDNIENDTISFGNETPFIYTDGTILNVEASDSTIYEDVVVTDSVTLLSGAKSFKLSKDNQPIIPVAGIYIRSDAIVKNNLENLRAAVKIPIEDFQKSDYAALEEYPNSLIDALPVELIPQNPFSSYAVTNAILNLNTALYSSLSADLERFVSAYEIKISESLLRQFDFKTDRNFELNGALTILDPANANSPNSELLNTNPGIYILNNVTNEIRRIFSSNDNVWSEDSVNNYLIAASKEIVIGGNLTFENTMTFTTPSLGSFVIPISGVINTDFTHFARIIINNEEYFLCLTESTQKLT